MSSLSHEQVRAYLQADRATLTSEEQAAMNEHLRDCAECQAYAAYMARLRAALTRTLHQRWDRQPVPKFAPRVLPRLRKSKLPRQVLSYAFGLGALAMLILVLQAFFSTRLQSTAQSPLGTELATKAPSVEAAFEPTTPPALTADLRPTPTPPSDRDFYRTQRLTHTTNGAFRPAASPDGQRVAYASERDGNWDIYVIDLNTQVETRLTDDVLPDMAPSWSPDGTRIAYQHNVPSADGPVLVDYIVMNADGSNKRVVFGGASWLKNEAPHWSPTGNRLAFSNSNELVVVELNDQSNAVRLQSADQQPYAWPSWFDNDHLVYLGNGQMMSADLAGNSWAVAGRSDPVEALAVAAPYIVYIQPQGTTTRVSQTGLDEIPPEALAILAAGPIEHAAVSPSGEFVAIQTESMIVVVAAGASTSGQLAPIFSLTNAVPPSDLLSVSWLPDSSGFVYVGSADGVPELHVAQLNRPAIDYLKSLPSFASTPTPTSQPLDTTALGAIETTFWPEPSPILAGQHGFSFGAAITTTSQIDVIAHIVAFPVWPVSWNDDLADCTRQQIISDQPFWANQVNFAAGPVAYNQNFSYTNDLSGATRLVVRINLIEAGGSGRLLYCTQQVYSLLPGDTPMPTPVAGNMTFTPIPAWDHTPTPSSSAPTATPYNPPQTPFPTATPYNLPPTPFPTATPYNLPSTSTPFPTATPYNPPPTPTPFP